MGVFFFGRWPALYFRRSSCAYACMPLSAGRMFGGGRLGFRGRRDAMLFTGAWGL